MGSDFQTTSWSVVLATRGDDTTQSREALAALCEAYWPPLFAFVRRQGHNPEDARDLTQAYFAQLLEKDYLQYVDPDAGKFRTFLLLSLKSFLSNEHDRARALKRAPARTILSLDVDTAENQYRVQPAHDMTPERIYERRWALTVLSRVLDRLRSEFEANGRSTQFERLKVYLSGAEPKVAYQQVSEELGMSVDAVKMAVHRMRKRYGRALRAEVAQTVTQPEEVDGEIRYLLSVIRG